jgi:hypothetical protein
MSSLRSTLHFLEHRETLLRSRWLSVVAELARDPKKRCHEIVEL